MNGDIKFPFISKTRLTEAIHLFIVMRRADASKKGQKAGIAKFVNTGSIYH